MKVLITGAYGQLGSEIKALSEVYPEMEFFFTDSDSLDIADMESVRQFVNALKPGCIINCAAYTSVDMAERDQMNAFRVNAKGPENLAILSRETGSRLIHISTDYVYDGKSSIPYMEGAATHPLNVYGKSKLEGERNIQKANPAALIIRTSWLYSSFGQNFVKTILRLGRENDRLQVVFDQTGTPTFAGDLAHAMLEIIAASAKDPGPWEPGVYHYSNEGVCSWYDFAMEIAGMAGIQVHIEPVESVAFPKPAVRPSYTVLNKTRIKSVYGIDIPYWKHSLKHCIELIKNHKS